MPNEKIRGKASSREHGTVARVGRQFGHGEESVGTWVKQADIDEMGEAEARFPLDVATDDRR